MTEDRLFEYEEVKPRRRRSKAPEPRFVPRTSAHGLIINRHGVSGFHLIRMINEYGSAHAECGFVGHLIEPDMVITKVPECLDCVKGKVARETTAREKLAKRRK